VEDGCGRKQGVWWVVVRLVVVVDIADNSPPVLPERISNNPKQLVRVANPNMHVYLVIVHHRSLEVCPFGAAGLRARLQ